MGDKYLDELKQIKKTDLKDLRRGEACLKLNTFDIKKARDIILKQKERELTENEKNDVMKVARRMLNATKKEFGVCFGYYILLGAEYAEKVGEGGNPHVKKKLFESYKKNPGMFDSQRVRDFFVRNRDSAVRFKKISKMIIPKVNYLIVLSFIYLVVGLFFLSTHFITGYVVGLESNYASPIGFIFVLFGIFGFYISFRKKS